MREREKRKKEIQREGEREFMTQKASNKLPVKAGKPALQTARWLLKKNCGVVKHQNIQQGPRRLSE